MGILASHLRPSCTSADVGGQNSLAGKVVLVTGAGSGVGRAAVLALAKDGAAKMVLAGRRRDPLDAVAREVSELSSGNTATLVVPTDVSNEASTRALFDAIAAHGNGRLDVLFNNAGAGAPPVPMDELPVTEWRRVVDLNLTGVFLCTREAFRLMKKQTPQGGRIINNGSISADRPRIFSAPYTATKHAVTGLTKSASLDGRAHDIACGQIDIGNAETDMTSKMKGVEPLMDARDVGRAVSYMAALPLDANVLFMTVMATKMPLVGRA